MTRAGRGQIPRFCYAATNLHNFNKPASGYLAGAKPNLFMALINCHECGTQMSDKAQSCPKCGAPNPNAAPVQQFSYQPQMMFNPCARHPQTPAVAHCGQCGAALCADCKDITAYEYDNKPLCIDCNIKVMESNISALKSTKRWSMVKFILLAFIVFIAFSIYSSNPGNWDTIFAAWIVAAIGGIFSTINMARRSEAEKAADDIYTRYNPGDGLMYEGMGCITRLALAIFFAPFYTAGYTIKHLFRWLSSSRKLNKTKQEYNNYIALLQERGEI